jgi:outer membrane protein OmpA-like peptidoglycan-associated protein
MAEDWLVDVQKYASDADEKIVAGIVRYCGIALKSRDSSLVAFSDKKETDLVRQNYLKKKLGLTQDDATLDAAIASVGTRMKADRTKNRVTVYYLLAEHFGLLSTFGAAKIAAKPSTAKSVAKPSTVKAAAKTSTATRSGDIGGVAKAIAPAAAVAAVAVAAPLAAVVPLAAVATAGEHDNKGARSFGNPPSDIIFTTGCATGLFVFGAIIVAALLAWLAYRPGTYPTAAPVVAAAPAVTAPAPAPAPVAAPAPQGSGVIAAERDSKPMLTVYFDTGKSAVTPDFAKAAEPVLAYLKANPAATLAISGFNDPTGNAAANERLSKNRAQNVKTALEALSVAADKAVMEKPAQATGTGSSNAESRRVEVVIKG